VNKSLICMLCVVMFISLAAGSPTGSALASQPASIAAPSYWYVEPGGNGSLPCLASDPCVFASAYASSANGDKIIFKEGTYHKNNMGWPMGLSYLIWLESKTTHIYGGWDGDPAAGSNPTLDPVNHQSILNGEHTTRVINVTGAGNTSTIAGFLITAGNAEDALNTHCDAMGISTGACGGGIYIYEASPNVHDNTFSFNNAVYSDAALDGVGGAIYANASPALVIAENWIIGNAANYGVGDGYGGGLHLYDCGPDVEVRDNILEFNNATTSTYTGWGAGAVIDFSGAQVLRNHFNHNNALGSEVIFGSTLKSTMSDLTLNDNQFTDNSLGDVISLNTTIGSMQRNLINNPEAYYGLSIWGGKPRGELIVINNMIVNQRWGNITISGIESNLADAVFYYNTVASATGGDSTNGVIVGDYADLFFTHGIVANHWYGFNNSSHSIGTVTIDSNLMYSNDLSNYDGFIATNTFSGDPKFVSIVNTSAANFHIGANSAARDKGMGFGGLNLDIDGQVRPNPLNGMLNAADLGADEFWGWFMPLIKK
jgi:hypothetical protein